MPQGLTGHSGHTFWPTSSSPPIQLEQEERPPPQRNTSQNGHTFWPITPLLYHERLEGRATRIHCEDGLALVIVWDEGNFAHLCGLDYYLDDSKRRRLPPRKLYEDLLKGRRISPKRVSPHGDVQWLKKKADVLTDAMDMSKVTHVVVSGNSRIVLYAGNEVWCIGLGRMRDERYYPQSLIKKSFDEVRKTGTIAHTVAAVETLKL